MKTRNLTKGVFAVCIIRKFWSIIVFLNIFLQVLVVSEDEILERNGDDRNVTLSDSIKEKTLRSELKGQVLRHLTKDTVVILDALNYIKGYRYELYCASKSVKTTQVTVHCDISSPTGWAWNESRFDEKNKWSKETFDALVMRYEAPIGTNRWDSPLLLSLEAIPLNLESLEAALFDRKPPPPNQSTQCQPLSSTNFLHELDKTTSSINSALLEAQKLGLGKLCTYVFIRTWIKFRYFEKATKIWPFSHFFFDIT